MALDTDLVTLLPCGRGRPEFANNGKNKGATGAKSVHAPED
ncbi:MAG: hypothetical protein ACI4QT_06065 [Kiritimatiellia bacterium]